MIDLNTANSDDLRRLGLDAETVNALVQWRPFSSWDAVLQTLEIDADGVRHLQDQGAVLGAEASRGWAIPSPFQLSQQHR